MVNYNVDVSSSGQSTSSMEPPKFMDTINPFLMFSTDDLEDMNKDVNISDSSDDSVDMGKTHHYNTLTPLKYIIILKNLENPPLNKDLRKRKREEENEEIKRKMFQPNVDKEQEEGQERQQEQDEQDVDKESNHSSSSSKKSDSDDESPVDKFRRGCDLPSDLDMGEEENSADSSNNEDLEDDGDWNMMGAALEREFLGLED